jgi:hypothetical protein
MDNYEVLKGNRTLAVDDDPETYGKPIPASIEHRLVMRRIERDSFLFAPW